MSLFVVWSDSKSTHTVRAHEYEILAVDWNKYNEFEIATGSVDKTVRIWVRMID